MLGLLRVHLKAAQHQRLNSLLCWQQRKHLNGHSTVGQNMTTAALVPKSVLEDLEHGRHKKQPWKYLDYCLSTSWPEVGVTKQPTLFRGRISLP
jgi:hypothetical protein